KYGVSVTDACISWEMTDALLREIHQFDRVMRSIQQP
ncbi:hypothetical protein ACUOCP_15755, partial [Escherichia sp. R-CC3]